VTRPFEGIEEKLKRANENIHNLEAEIAWFFQKSEYPVLSTDNVKLIPEAIEYHKNLIIPLRFSLLAGEIVHHLRSCFDHVVWHFSDAAYRAANMKFIDFPVLETRPTKEQLFTRYERKVKGITKPEVLDFIERLQPYNCSDPVDSLLFIIHQLDIFDKHRELIIVGSTGGLEVPVGLFERYMSYQCGEPGSAPVDIGAEFKRDGKIVPQVAFGEFGKGGPETVTQGLYDLNNFTVKIMERFYGYI